MFIDHELGSVEFSTWPRWKQTQVRLQLIFMYNLETRDADLRDQLGTLREAKMKQETENGLLPSVRCRATTLLYLGTGLEEIKENK